MTKECAVKKMKGTNLCREKILNGHVDLGCGLALLMGGTSKLQ